MKRLAALALAGWCVLAASPRAQAQAPGEEAVSPTRPRRWCTGSDSMKCHACGHVARVRDIARESNRCSLGIRSPLCVREARPDTTTTQGQPTT